MAILAAITAFFTALPDLVKLGQEVFAFFKHLAGDDPQGFIKELGSAFEKVNNAKNSEDKLAAAADIVKLINKL